MGLSRAEAHRARFFGASLPLLRDRLAAAGASALLDAGGGTGWLAELVGEGCPRRVVVDPSARARRSGARRRPQIEFVDGRGERLAFADGTFDRALMAVSLHHLSDAAAALRELHRVLRPGAVVCILEFLPGSGKGKGLARCGRHLHFMTPEALRTALEAAAFSVDAVEIVGPGFLVTARRG